MKEKKKLRRPRGRGGKKMGEFSSHPWGGGGLILSQKKTAKGKKVKKGGFSKERGR